jgi:hypothetical protein
VPYLLYASFCSLVSGEKTIGWEPLKKLLENDFGNLWKEDLAQGRVSERDIFENGVELEENEGVDLRK